MGYYESTFIARPDIPAADVDKLTEDFTKIVKDNGGKVVRTEYWGLRSLAYRVHKNKRGHYVMLVIEAPGAAIKEIEHRYNLNEDIMRGITIRTDKLSNDNSSLFQGEKAVGAKPPVENEESEKPKRKEF